MKRIAHWSMTLLLVASFAMPMTGCTHVSLSKNTVLTTTTVMEIKYCEVLSNIALFSVHPEALPNHVDLAQGVVQVNDRAGIGQSGGITTLGNSGLEQFGPSAQRQVTEQWGTDATTDPERLTDLQAVYRVTLGLHPLPLPNSIAYLRLQKKLRESRAQKENGNGNGNGSGNGNGGSSDDEDDDDDGPTSPDSPGGGGSTPSTSSSSSSDSDRQVPLEVLLTDVPLPGWYGVGAKADVPSHACYVGHHGDRYAWVTAEGVPCLSRLTVVVQTIIKLSPASSTEGGPGGSGRGLAVSAGG